MLLSKFELIKREAAKYSAMTEENYEYKVQRRKEEIKEAFKEATSKVSKVAKRTPATLLEKQTLIEKPEVDFFIHLEDNYIPTILNRWQEFMQIKDTPASQILYVSVYDFQNKYKVSVKKIKMYTWNVLRSLDLVPPYELLPVPRYAGDYVALPNAYLNEKIMAFCKKEGINPAQLAKMMGRNHSDIHMLMRRNGAVLSLKKYLEFQALGVLEEPKRLEIHKEVFWSHTLKKQTPQK